MLTYYIDLKRPKNSANKKMWEQVNLMVILKWRYFSLEVFAAKCGQVNFSNATVSPIGQQLKHNDKYFQENFDFVIRVDTKMPSLCLFK